MTELEAIQAATVRRRRAARYGRSGYVSPGAYADLIAVKAIHFKIFERWSLGLCDEGW